MDTLVLKVTVPELRTERVYWPFPQDKTNITAMREKKPMNFVDKNVKNVAYVALFPHRIQKLSTLKSTNGKLRGFQ